MITINIDTQRLIADFYLSPEEVQDVMDYTVKEITGRFAEEWAIEAGKTLKSSRQEYIANLNVVDEGFAKGAVVLTGWLPNAIESGIDGFDMKTYFLEGPNAKLGKNGNRFNTIPFSHGTPGSLEENFNGGILPTEVHDIVKERNEKEPLQKYDLKNLPNQFKEPQKKQIKLPQSQSFKDYQHKHSIYEGVAKVKDKTTGQNRYESFRRVSDTSYSDSWIYPGLEAKNIAEKVLERFDIVEEMGRVMDKIL